ncbi:MAG TPA: aminoglycoside 6-adenylyltransferase, partial [Herpetosiphonaceae bacterium]
QDPPPQNNGSFIYLMQFTDGNRIDLGLVPISALAAFTVDSLSQVLLDKDGLLPPLGPPSDGDYLPRPPSAQAFADCCNEFWWVSLGVAKGLWRDELPYAKHIFERFVREQLMKMLSWYVGVKTGFARSPGKFGKYLKQELEPELWQLLEQTYADASSAASWDALFAMCALFRITALHVAAEYGFAYPAGDDQRVSAHLAHVRSLPRDAQEIY